MPLDDLHRALARELTSRRRVLRNLHHMYLERGHEMRHRLTRLAGALGHPGVNREADWDRLVALVMEQRAELAKAKLLLAGVEPLPVSTAEAGARSPVDPRE